MVSESGGEPRLNFLSRLIGVYFSPSESFADMGRSAGIVLPVLLLTLLTVISVVVTFDRIPADRMMNEQVDRMVEEGRMTAEQAEQQREQMAKFAPYTKIISAVVAGFFTLLVPILLAGVARLVLLMMGVESRFMPLWSVSVYALLAVSIISITLFTLIIFIKPTEEIDLRNPLNSNLASILSLAGVTGLPKFVTALLGYVDAFYIWKIILLGIGYAAVAPRLKRSTSLAICSGGGILLAVVGAAWSSLFG